MTFLFFFEEKTYNENKKLHKEEKACENTQTRYIDNYTYREDSFNYFK